VYVCALRPRGTPLNRTDVFGYIARMERGTGRTLHTLVEGPFAAIAVEHGGRQRCELGRWRSVYGAGDVRLDNRAEVAAIAGVDGDVASSDLELVLAALHAAGEACIVRLLGDFAFVAWDARAHKLLAVRDAFGVKPLYRRATPDLRLFSSHTAPLQSDESYDLDYISSWLAGVPPAERTVWRGVEAVGAGMLVRQRGTIASQERFWHPAAFIPEEAGDEESNCTRFRELLERGVRTRLAAGGEVWAQLSGGLDSSTVVALAGMALGGGQRIGGTVTIVDALGDGDEREFSDAVVKQFGLRNEQVRNYWAWQEDGMPPPRTDLPTPMYPFYARDRRVHEIVRNAGARVLLSGMGADHYLCGSLDYITDLASAGRLRAAVREVTSWSVATRQSFWRLGARYLVEPFLPAGMRRIQPQPLPPWLRPHTSERVLAGAAHAVVTAGAAGAAGAVAGTGQRFARRVAAGVAGLPAWLERWPFGDDVEMRYPFLYRPLVEWSLRLPVRQRIRPEARKWILRQATRGVLPEAVRVRSTKGGIDGRILWSLHHERRRVDGLLKDPVLAQLGCVDGAALRAAVERARCGVPVNNVHLFSALSLETWLRVRTGLWNSVQEASASAA
jgi:asparagine synthase (glutamine-hydrolysing)